MLTALRASRPLSHLRSLNYSTMPMPTDMRAYIATGNANPGPGDRTAKPGGDVIPKAWYAFGDGAWAPVRSSSSSSSTPPSSVPLRLATWNVDGWTRSANARLEAILTHVFTLNPAPDLVLLQELTPANIEQLLAHPAIREKWYCTEDAPAPPGVPIVQATLASRTRFAPSHLGEVHVLTLPSRYERVALVADVTIGAGSGSGERAVTVRTANVHLDSLAHDPSFRPAQVRLIAQSIEQAGGHGLIAGDWNSVLPIDDSLCGDNGLTDAWLAVRGAEDGFTWNWDGRSKEPFPPNRLDKIAVAGLRCESIEVLEPGTLQPEDGGADWSDHCGLRGAFVVESAPRSKV